MLNLSTIYVNAIYLTRFGSLSYFGECIWLFHNKLYMDHFSFCYIFETRSFLWAALFFYSCFLFCSEASLISLVIFSAIQFCIASSFSFSPCYSRHLNYNLEEQIFICWWRLPLPPITQALLYLQSSVPLLLQLGLEILAFPCNQSAGQELGSNEQIVEFVCTRFKAEYPIFGKGLSNEKPFFFALASKKQMHLFRSKYVAVVNRLTWMAAMLPHCTSSWSQREVVYSENASNGTSPSF